MSNKYSRIKLELTDLSPNSVSEIFLFLHNCLANDLSIDYYKKNVLKYSIQEQYFISYYAKQYFSSSYKSYLSRWMEEQVNEVGREETLLNHFENIGKRAESLLAYLNQTENTLIRQAKKAKNKRVKTIIKQEVYDYRIPLYFKPKSKEDIIYSDSLLIDKNDFYSKLYDVMSIVMDNIQFDRFFNNSFAYLTNPFSIELLNIEIGNSEEVYAQFHKFYILYKEQRNHQNKLIEQYYKEKIEEIKQNKNSLSDDSVKKKFIRIPSIPLMNKVTRTDIMKIMYNTFPQIRESASEYLIEHPKSNLASYLKTKSRNIKNA